MYSGAVPQHPPTRLAPRPISSFMLTANRSGVIRYTGCPCSSISGIPAFGFTTMGILALSLIHILETCGGAAEELSVSFPYSQAEAQTLHVYYDSAWTVSYTHLFYNFYKKLIP